jgi:hypothetical protein
MTKHLFDDDLNVTIDSETSALPLGAGEAHVGSVGGSLAQVAVSFTHSTDTTPYSAKDSIAPALTITGATNASPIVIACTGHGLSDDDIVTIAGVTGNTNANGNFYVKATGQDANHFALYSDAALQTPVAGNGAYGGSPTCTYLFRFPNIFRVNGGSGYVTRAIARTNNKLWTGQLKYHFYGGLSGSQLDNAPFLLLWANLTYRQGSVVLPALAAEDPTNSDSAVAQGTPGDSNTTGIPLAVANKVGTRDLWCRVEQLGTDTPVSGQLFVFGLDMDQY